MLLRTAAAVAALAFATASVAQDAAPPVLQAVAQSAAPAFSLPANTELHLVTNQEITTKGTQWSEGDTFSLSLAEPVMLGNYVVIPKGTKGVGRITWLTSKGAFGKSGKMDISLDYLDLGNTRIPIEGTYRQEGEGNTVATVGGVIAVGVFAGFITGKSARIPMGRELIAHTKEALPVALPAGATLDTSPVVTATIAPPVTAVAPAPAPNSPPLKVRCTSTMGECK